MRIEAAALQIRVYFVVNMGGSSWVGQYPQRHKDDNALAGTREQHPISILQIKLHIGLVRPLPCCTSKAEVLPATLTATKIAIPANTGPVQFEALDVKLGCCLF